MSRATTVTIPAKRLPSGRVPRSAIRRYVRALVERFKPQQVILFGSHAYGTPHADSDVDLFVLIDCWSMHVTTGRMYGDVAFPVPTDLVVFTPKYLAQRRGRGCPFVREIFEKGIVLYDAHDTGMARQGRSGSAHRPKVARRPTARIR